MRLALLSTLLLTATAGTAAAQSNAPGSGNCECEVGPPAAAPVARLSKWGIGLRATSLALHAESSPDAESHFGGGGIQLRYRLGYKWELEGSIDGLREQLEDGSEGSRELGSATLAARYHLRPFARWDWYGVVGVGVLTESYVDDTDARHEVAQAGAFHLGAGLERRFGRFGIAAELRMVAAGPFEPIEDGVETQPVPPRDQMSTVPTEEIEAEGNSGGQFTLAGTFYF